MKRAPASRPPAEGSPALPATAGRRPASRPGAPLWRPGEPVEPLRALLARGGILALPTESSYGLGADPGNPVGVAAVYRVKGRGEEKPLPIVISHPDQLVALGIDPAAPGLAAVARHWPAPLSVLLPTALPVPAAAGSGTLAVRVPDQPLLRQLLAALGTALTATSANRSGEPALLDPAAVSTLLAGEDAVVVDGGALPGGAPSTIVAATAGGLEVIRRGRFPVEEIGGGRGRG
jgi:L-threonylcarbamoyladenylate synthase